MANSNDWHTPGASLTLPFGGAPGAPFVVLSGSAADLPADLIAYYAGFGETVIAGFVFFSGVVAYDYQVFLSSGVSVFMAFGGKDTGGTIGEANRVYGSAGFAQTEIGTHNANAQLSIVNGGDISFTGNGLFVVGGSVGMVLQSTASLTFTSTGNLDMQNGFLLISAPASFNQGTDSPWFIDGVSAGRGLRAQVASTASTAAIAAETVALTAPSMTWRDGRAYLVKMVVRCSHSAAQTFSYRVRQTNLAGASKLFFQFQVTAAIGNSYTWEGHIRRATGAGNLTDNIVVTMAASAGTVTAAAAADVVRYLEVWDCGAEADFPTAITI